MEFCAVNQLMVINRNLSTPCYWLDDSVDGLNIDHTEAFHVHVLA